MFSVVEFLVDNSVQLVPSKWLGATKTKCKWPPGPPASLIKKLKDVESAWSTFDVKVLKKVDDYGKGKKLEQKAVVSLSLDTTDSEAVYLKRKSRLQRPTNKRFKPKNQIESSNETSESDADISSNASSFLHSELELNADNIFTTEEVSVALVGSPIRGSNKFDLVTPNTSVAILGSKEISTNSNSSSSNKRKISLGLVSSHNVEEAISQAFSTNLPTPLTSTPTGILQSNKYSLFPANESTTSTSLRTLNERLTAFEESVTSSLSLLKKDVSEILTRLTCHQTSDRTNQLTKLPVELPLKTLNELEQLEAWIKDNPVNRGILVNICASYGGRNASKIVRGILKKVFSSSLARNINYIGTGGKTAFKNLLLKSVVIDSTVCQKDGKESKDEEILTVVKNWFGNS